jgi:hypothetical protein
MQGSDGTYGMSGQALQHGFSERFARYAVQSKMPRWDFVLRFALELLLQCCCASSCNLMILRPL